LPAKLHETRIGQQFLDGTRDSLGRIARSLEAISKELTLIRYLAEDNLPGVDTAKTDYVILKDRLGVSIHRSKASEGEDEP